MAGQNAFAKARSETLDLILDLLQHVYFRSVGHMAVGPGNVLARGSTRTIKQRGLRKKNKRTIWELSVSYRFFRRGDFFEASAEMNACSAQAIGCFPRNRRVERVIDFEGGRAVAKSCELSFVAFREFVSSYLDQLPGSQVTENQAIAIER